MDAHVYMNKKVTKTQINLEIVTPALAQLKHGSVYNCPILCGWCSSDTLIYMGLEECFDLYPVHFSEALFTESFVARNNADY